MTTNLKDLDDFDLSKRRDDLSRHLSSLSARVDAAIDDPQLDDDGRRRADAAIAEAKATETKLEAIDAELAARAPRGRVTAPTDPRRTRHGLDAPAATVSRTGSTFSARVFGHELADTGGFHGLAGFMRAISENRYDARLEKFRVKNAFETGVGESGGFYVPTSWRTGLIDAIAERSVVLGRARIVNLEAQSVRLPGFDSEDRSTKGIGGFASQWLAEGADATVQTGKVRSVLLTARKLALYAQATEEMLQDGLNFESELRNTMAQAIAWDLDDAFFNGNGAGLPLGILAAPATVEVAKETGQANDTVVLENVLAMFSRLHPSQHMGAAWFVHPSVVPQLFRLQVAVQNVAGTENVGGFGPGVFSQQGESMFLLGKPIVLTEKLPTLGDAGDILLANLNQYAVGLRRSLSIESAVEPGWLSYSRSFRAVLRADGAPLLSHPLTPANGSTMSAFVTLGAR